MEQGLNCDEVAVQEPTVRDVDGLNASKAIWRLDCGSCLVASGAGRFGITGTSSIAADLDVA
jgi:hypothetical protein